MTLLDAEVGEEYIIKEILTDDEEMDAFLFTLGCYSGEPITVVSRKKGGCVVSIKDGRYNIDDLLAEAIVIWDEYIVVSDHHIYFAPGVSQNYLKLVGRNCMKKKMCMRRESK